MLGAVTDADRYRLALLDWLACAARGIATSRPPGPLAPPADGLAERVTAAGCAGHVLDYDDTYSPGLVHASAAGGAGGAAARRRARSRLGGGARRVRGRLRDDGGACAREPPGALRARLAPHRGLRERRRRGRRGPPARPRRRSRSDAAVALALLRAGGLRAAFGSDGKALQVGLAAAAGLQAARIARAARASALAGRTRPGRLRGRLRRHLGRAAATGPRDRARTGSRPTRAACDARAIDAALELRRAVRVPAGDSWSRASDRAPRRRPATTLSDGLQAKFSIPYIAAHTLLHGAADRAELRGAVDEEARSFAAAQVAVRTDPALLEMEARLEVGGQVVGARFASPRGSPQRPMDAAALARKVRAPARRGLDGRARRPRRRRPRDVGAAAGLL